MTCSEIFWRVLSFELNHQVTACWFVLSSLETSERQISKMQHHFFYGSVHWQANRDVYEELSGCFVHQCTAKQTWVNLLGQHWVTYNNMLWYGPSKSPRCACLESWPGGGMLEEGSGGSAVPSRSWSSEYGIYSQTMNSLLPSMKSCTAAAFVIMILITAKRLHAATVVQIQLCDIWWWQWRLLLTLMLVIRSC